MSKLMDEIKYDANFIKGHTLQPKWWKVLKVFIVLGFLVGFYLLVGLVKTVVFAAVFFFLMTIVHLVYRWKTKKFKQSWLDFIVIEEEDGLRYERIGIYYYSAIVINLIIALVISLGLL
jgi:hypothetical protein